MMSPEILLGKEIPREVMKRGKKNYVNIENKVK